MKKLNFVTPEAEIILFASADVITASTGNTDPIDTPEDNLGR